MKIQPVMVKSSKILTEAEALEMLRSLKPRNRGALDAIKDYILNETTRGNSYGLFSIKSVSGQKMDEEDKKAIIIRINADFTRLDYKVRVRYVPDHDSIIYAPLAKMDEIFR